MDVLKSIMSVAWVIPVVIVLAVVLIAALYVKSRWKVAKADQALVVTGSKKGMNVRVAGGGFVSPFQKHQFFPLGVMTVSSPDQETQTITLIPVVVKWTAQLRPDTEDDAALQKAVVGFIDRDVEAIKDSLQRTLDGEVRAVVATLTPEEVVTQKEGFSSKVSSNVADRMTELGFKLISLNIAEVSDRKGYYDNLAAKDREERRRTAEVQIADANREVAVAQAASDRISESAKLDKDLAVAEKNRDVTLRKAQFKGETEQADIDAEYAGQLKAQDREAELAARKGQVSVVEQQQAQATALARREVAVTDAETLKREREIEAESDARKSEIEAQAAANVAQRKAEGEAKANIERAKGEADAINATASAEAERTRITGLATAEVARAQGEAEAAATLARGKADAKVQSLMAEALAANDGANLRVTLAQIERDTTVTIYTETAKVMGRVGEKAQFIDMGGSSKDGGDLLSSVLGNIPKLFKGLDVESQALNGLPFGALIGSTLAGMRNGTPSAQQPAAPTTEPAAAAEAAFKEPAAPAADSTPAESSDLTDA